MKASIIICTRNRAAHLRETLLSLTSVHVPPGMLGELLVIDNGSTDGTSEMVSAFPMANMSMRVLSEPRPGQCYARNTGLGAAEGDIILFTDDDLRLPTDWLESMCRPLQSGEADGVGGAVALAPHLQRPWMEQVHRYWLAETGPADLAATALEERQTMVGANMAFTRRVLDQVPEFDTNLGPGALGFADDTLFSRQVWAAGRKIVYSEKAKVEHHFQPDRLSRTSFLDTARKHGQTKAYLAHHWEHRTIAAPAAQMARKWLQVALWRRHHPQTCAELEGLPTGELYNLVAYYFYRSYLIERRKPRFYEKHGLKKNI